MKKHSPSDLRRRLDRYVHLGLIASYTRAAVGAYEITTPAGDVDTIEPAHLPAYLQGLASGAWAARKEAAR